MQRRKLLLLTFVLLWLVACGPSGAVGTLQENGEAFSPALATWDYATTENVLVTNTSVAATVAAGGGTPTPDLTRWAEETRAAPSPTVTATPTPYCEPREEPPVTASLSARLEAAVAEAQIPGLDRSDVVALDRLCYGYAEGEETRGGSTWFYVAISVPGTPRVCAVAS